MFYDKIIAQLEKRADVHRAVEIGDTIRILATDSPSYAAIEEIIGDVDFEVIELAEHPTTDLPLFRGELSYHEYKGRGGELRQPGEAKMLQHRAKLQHEPKTNVLIGDDVGLLFGSLQDKFRFDEWNRGKD